MVSQERQVAWGGSGTLLVTLSFGLLLPACSEDSKAEDAAGKCAAGWRVGVDVTDITPTEAQLASGKLFMGAYGILTQRGPATGVHDPIYARTMVLRSGCESIALSILDMPGIGNRVLHAIAAQVVSKTDLAQQSVLVGATHSHSAPDFQGLWGSVPADYRQRVIDLTAQSIVNAYTKAKPAELFVSKGTAPNRNRRSWPETDTELTVLDAKTAGGERIGTLVNFAAHPVKLGAENKLISRDFCGYTVDKVQAQLGAPALFFNGIVGDVSPDGGGSSFEGAQVYGELVADGALSAIAANTAVSPGIYREQTPWQQQVTNAAFIGLNSAGLLDYDAVTDGGAMALDTQYTYFRLGKELQAVAFPGEALTRTGLEVKAKMTKPFRLWLGLTTDTLGYFVKSDEWMTGHNGDYEESVSMGQTAGDNAIRVLSDALANDPAP